MRLATVLLAALIGGVPALAEDRALVIGNADYRHAPDLAGSDTAGLAKALREAGFITQDGIDLDAASLSRLIEALARADDNPGARIVALNGRFLHSAAETWFMGSDAGSPGPATVVAQGLPLSLVMRLMTAGPPGAVLILGTDDQQMPHQPGLRNGIGALPDADLGLSVITGTPEAGARLVTALTRGATLRQAASAEPGLQLQAETGAASGRWRGAALAGDAAQQQDRELWADVALADSRQDHDAYLARFPDGIYAEAARARLRQLDRPEASRQADRRAWLAAASANSAAGYQDYLAQFATGRRADLARLLLARLLPAELAPQAAASAQTGPDLRDADRAAVQRQLARLGHDPGAADGVFGPRSRKAIAAWQRANDLDATGHLTRAQLRLIARQSRAAEPAHPNAVPQAATRDPQPQGGGLRGLASRLGLAVAVADPDVLRDDAATWRWSRRQDSGAAYETYLERFPTGSHAGAAGERLRTLRAATEAARSEENALDLDRARRLLVEEVLQLAGMQPGPVDGEFTDETRAALRRYQAARNLRVTGHVTQQTMASLMAAGAGG